MTIDQGLVVVHVAAVVAYLGGGFLLRFSVGSALERVSPGPASIVARAMGSHFVVISWGALVAWAVTGYWMLHRRGWLAVDSPQTLFLEPDIVASSPGKALVVMMASWYLLVVSACIITFILRPRLARRLPPDADLSPDDIDAATARMQAAGRWIEILANVNLVLGAVGFVSAKLYY